MADKVTTTNTLAVGIEYDEVNTTSGRKMVYMKTPNPKANLTEQQIKTAYNQTITPLDPQDTNSATFYLNPRTGAPLTGYNPEIKTAYKEEVETIELDLD